MHTLGRLAAAMGDVERAARLYVASAVLREAIGAPPRLAERPDYERDLAAARATLSEGAFAAARTDGQVMSPEEAIDYALAAGRPALNPAAGTLPTPVAGSPPVEPSVAAPSTTLTRRELEVVALIAQGMTNRQIAERLIISEWTVDSHVRHILTKLEVRSRAQVATWAIKQGLVKPRPS